MADSKIKQQELEQPADLPAGVPEGTVEKTSDSVSEPLRDRIEHEEKVVHDYDADGNVIGWHKEPATGGNA